LAGWPCLFVGFWAQSPWVFLPALTLGCFFYFLCMPAVNTQIANVASPAQRATAWALAVFILHMLGDTAAPPLFGFASRQLGRQQAFAFFSFALLLSGACCLIAAWTAPADTERVARRIAQQNELHQLALGGDPDGLASAATPGAAAASPTGPATVRPEHP
jgi:hypothetical protein